MKTAAQTEEMQHNNARTKVKGRKKYKEREIRQKNLLEAEKRRIKRMAKAKEEWDQDIIR